MILYFSASGNSRYVAKYLASQTYDDIICLNDRIKNKDFSEIRSDKPVILVCPIYAWRIPRIVEEYLNKISITGNRKIYVLVTTCGLSANSGKYANLLCRKIKMEYMGIHTFHMSGCYVAFMENPDIDHAEEMNHKARVDIRELIPCINKEIPIPQEKVSLLGRFMSKVANPIFYKHIIGKPGFYATDQCIHCGKCVTVCPMNNIQMKDNKPVWGTECTHCMACIHQCPAQATEYKKITKGKNRFYNNL